MDRTTDQAIHHEPARDLPLVESCDVLVAGGGPAGIAAALAAARRGARVRLIEAGGCLGGIWTSGLLCWVIDAHDKGGIMAEIAAALDRRDARRYRPGQIHEWAYDPEQMKLVLEELALAAGVQVRLHTRLAAAACDQQGGVAVAITESRAGREAWHAAQFIDCTGDGDLAAHAGCGFDLGDAADGRCQPLTLMALLAGPPAADIAPFIGGANPGAKRRLLETLRAAGVDPSYAGPTLFCLRDGLYGLMANHEYGVLCHDAQRLSDATIRARAEVDLVVRTLRGLGAPWQDLRQVATGAHIGVREGRRIHGRHTVTAAEAEAGVVHPDEVCRVNFGWDVHSTDPSKSKEVSHGHRAGFKPYGIPLRALIARDRDRLLLAGRCISGDFLAHSSYRVTGNACTLGEVAGGAAALAATTGRLVQDIPWAEIRAVVPARRERTAAG